MSSSPEGKGQNQPDGFLGRGVVREIGKRLTGIIIDANRIGVPYGASVTMAEDGSVAPSRRPEDITSS